MSIVNAPLTRADRPPSISSSSTVRAMEVGQHVIAALLTAIGVIRALGEGTPAAAAIVAGLAILAWHTAGTILPSRSHSRKHLTWWLVGFALIWSAAVWVSAEFVWVAFLLWLLAGHLLPGIWAIVFSLVVYALVATAPILHQVGTNYASIFGPLIGGVFALGISRGYLQLLRQATERERLVTSLSQAQEEMAALQDELALVGRRSGEVAERTRLSRDIHDTIAQSLSSIRLISHAARNQSSDPGTQQSLNQVETLASESLADVRRIVSALAPSELEDNALVAALGRILSRLQEEAGITPLLNADDSLPMLRTEIEVALLRTAQSALANVRLHSNASQVALSLIDADDAVRLDIIDDGIGFDIEAWNNVKPPADATSYGLRFMRARLRELGGGLDIESAPGDGTAVSAYLPIQLPQKGYRND